MNNALDKLEFVPIQVASAMSKSASEIKDEVDSQLGDIAYDESHISIDSDGSFEVKSVSYIEYDIDYIKTCAKDSIEKNINHIKGGY